MFWCFHCYGLNAQPCGPCRHCGDEIAEPDGLTHQQRLIWTLGHPDADRAVLAARALGHEQASAAAPVLRRLVSDAQDPYLAAEALRALVAIEGRDRLDGWLSDLARSGPVLVRRAALALLAADGPT